LYLLGKKSAFSALDFIHIKARARVESAPSFSRRVVSRVLLLLEKHSFLYRERHAHVYIYRERESAQRSKADKKVKSNLSGKEKNPRETSLSLSLSLSLSRSLSHRETRARKRAETFFIGAKKSREFVFFHSSRVVPRAPLVSDLFSLFVGKRMGENWGLKKGGN